ncbi:metallophosphoesterase [Bacillus luteolus]|uniref:Metallophosphoesterase n=1 Tax=Litchfieldia luteola TaxID=682179 RepID=A0ABR9QNN8_9BACI|nr:metallophosphoesterase [Cytobacillus luteolus]MBE4910121.1 metallophosphoesterase [Cytobacillus luteolus]MBP1942315.1 putative MPP superfamily phosphohydrolase [Cytobacillus luteolus]
MSFFLIAILIIVLAIGIYRANKNTHNVVMNRIDVNASMNKIDNPNSPTLNILHLSDIHLENLSISPDTLYQKLKDEKIDLIALTGDFLDRKRSIPKLVPYLQVLNKLQVEHGMYAIFGNHDYVLKNERFEELRKTLEDNGCITMQNENASILIEGNKLNIIGIDDFSTKRSDIEKSYKNIKGGYNLVLTHDPNIVLHMDNYHFDYLLSGHFHGGQIHWPRPYHLAKMGKLARLNIIKGFHERNGKPYYISEGLGQTGVNIRVGSLPEITIHKVNITCNDQIVVHTEMKRAQ